MRTTTTACPSTISAHHINSDSTLFRCTLVSWLSLSLFHIFLTTINPILLSFLYLKLHVHNFPLINLFSQSVCLGSEKIRTNWADSWKVERRLWHLFICAADAKCLSSQTIYSSKLTTNRLPRFYAQGFPNSKFSVAWIECISAGVMFVNSTLFMNTATSLLKTKYNFSNSLGVWISLRLIDRCDSSICSSVPPPDRQHIFRTLRIYHIFASTKIQLKHVTIFVIITGRLMFKDD